MFNKFFSGTKFYKCLLVVLLLIPFYSNATHIVGGDLTYESLGSNRYRIKLTVYRDCLNGQVGFDNPALVGIFDQNNTLIDSLKLNFKGSSPVPSILKDPCTTPPTNVCYEVTVYDTILVFLPKVGGYTLSYERCCRNKTILNIFDPENAGACYFAHIPGSDVTSKDSNPRFKNLAPTFTCANNPFIFDQSAVDDDGDSLVYELTAPYLGGPYPTPIPDPPNPPPYSTVTWQAPYSLANLMGGIPLQINPKTGLMTATPNTIGQFVIGVRVKEYRNGTYIGETTRDFQINVTPCGRNVVSSILTPTNSCGSNLATFTNNSTGAGAFRWDFGVVPLSNDTSRSASPSYTYPGVGKYKVQLVAYSSTNSDCRDTAYGDVNIYPSLVSNFNYVIGNCTTSVTFADSSSVVGNYTNNYQWYFGDNTTSVAQNPSHTYAAEGTYTVKLVVVSKSGCKDSITKSIVIRVKPPINGGTDKTVCQGIATSIGTAGNTSLYTYNWSPATGLASPSSPVTAANPAATTTYVLTVTGSSASCSSKDTVVVTILLKPAAVAGNDKTICKGDTIQIGGPNSIGNSYSWTPATGLINNTVSNPLAHPTVSTTYIIKVTNQNTCTNQDTVGITVLTPNATAGPNVPLCVGYSIKIGSANNPDYTYSWTPATGLNDPNISNPTARPFVTTTYVLNVKDNITGCKLSDAVVVTINPLPSFNIGRDTSVCDNSSIQIGPANNSNYNYNWFPFTGLSAANVARPFASPSITTTYFLTVSDKTTGCTKNDTLELTVFPAPPANAGNDGGFCANDPAPISIGGTGNAAYTYSWLPVTGLINPNTAQTNAHPSATTTYTLKVLNPVTGCNSNDQVIVSVNPLPVLNLVNDSSICLNTQVSLQSSSNNSYIYNWTPATGLNNPAIGNPVATVNSNIKYRVLATDKITACKNTDSVSFTVVPLPVSIAGPSTTLCKGSKIIIGTQPNPNYQYKWAPTLGLDNPNISSPVASPTANTTYYVTTTDKATLCYSVDSMVISIFSPVANAGTDKIVCMKDSAQIGSSLIPGYTYHWSPVTGLSDSISSGPFAKPNITTRYILTTLYTTYGCIFRDTVNVTVNLLPPAITGPDKSICLHDTVSLGTSAINGVQYKWTPSSGLDNAFIANPKANPAVTTTYTLTTTNILMCSNSNKVIVNIKLLPPANAGRDTTVCEGISVKIGAGTIPGLSYNWKPGASLTSTVISNPFAHPVSTTKYYLTVTDNTTGCTNSDSAVIGINPLPVVITGGDQNICLGAGTTIGGANNNAYTYLWTPATALSSTVVSNPMASPVVATTYTLHVTDKNTKCFKSDSAKITIIPVPIVDAGTSQFICKGTSTFIGNTNTNIYHYVWHPGKYLSDSTAAKPVASPLFTTKYYLTASDLTGTCSSIDSAIVTVYAPDAVAGPDKPVCIGSGTLIGSANNPNYLYSWSPKKGLSDSTISNPFAQPQQTTRYILKVTDNINGCRAWDTVNVIVNSILLSGTGPDLPVCLKDSVLLGLPTNKAAYNYTWSPATYLNNTTTTRPLCKPLANITYTVTITDPLTGCFKLDTVKIIVNPLPVYTSSPDVIICSSDSIQIGNTADIAYQYLWSPVAGLNNPVLAKPNASPSVTTNYTLKISNNFGCSIKDTVKVEVALIQLNIPPTARLCKFDTLILNQGGGIQYTYNWSPPTGLNSNTASSPVAVPLVTTTYTVTITQLSTLGTVCMVQKQVVVDVSPDTLGLELGRDTVVCKGNFISLKAKGPGKPDTFHWSHFSDFSDMINVNNNDSILRVKANGKPVKYYLSASNGYCFDTDSILISSDSLLITTTGSSACINNTVTLSVNNLSGKPLSYLWSPLYNIIGGNNTGSIIVKPLQTTTYFVQATDAANCVSVISAVASIINPPGITATADKYNLYEGENTTLHASPSDINYMYQWDPAIKLDNPAIADPVTSTTETTLYFVTVTDMNNALQCSIKDSVLVNIKPRTDCGEPRIFIPNAFTPDGDGRNDVLYVRGDNISELELIIYNRWGEKMIEIHNISQGWDGTYNGNPADPGVFVYYLRLKCTDGESYFKKGNITLLK